MTDAVEGELGNGCIIVRCDCCLAMDGGRPPPEATTSGELRRRGSIVLPVFLTGRRRRECAPPRSQRSGRSQGGWIPTTMTSEEKRIIVSGLTRTISTSDLTSRFSAFGVVKAVDGLGKLDALGQPRKYAYVTLESTPAMHAKCIYTSSTRCF